MFFPVHKAVMNNDIDLSAKLIKNGHNIHEKDEFQTNPLHKAI